MIQVIRRKADNIKNKTEETQMKITKRVLAVILAVDSIKTIMKEAKKNAAA